MSILCHILGHKTDVVYRNTWVRDPDTPDYERRWGPGELRIEECQRLTCPHKERTVVRFRGEKRNGRAEN